MMDQDMSGSSKAEKPEIQHVEGTVSQHAMDDSHSLASSGPQPSNIDLATRPEHIGPPRREVWFSDVGTASTRSPVRRLFDSVYDSGEDHTPRQHGLGDSHDVSSCLEGAHRHDSFGSIASLKRTASTTPEFDDDRDYNGGGSPKKRRRTNDNNQLERPEIDSARPPSFGHSVEADDTRTVTQSGRHRVPRDNHFLDTVMPTPAESALTRTYSAPALANHDGRYVQILPRSPAESRVARSSSHRAHSEQPMQPPPRSHFQEQNPGILSSKVPATAAPSQYEQSRPSPGHRNQGTVLTQGETARDSSGTQPASSQPFHHHVLPLSRAEPEPGFHHHGLPSPREPEPGFHSHRLPAMTSLSITSRAGTHNNQQLPAFQATSWDGSRRSSLDLPSFPLPPASPFQHNSQIAPLRRQSEDQLPPTNNTATALQGPTLLPLSHNSSIRANVHSFPSSVLSLPPLSSLERSRPLVGTRGTVREAPERGPELAPLTRAADTPPRLPHQPADQAHRRRAQLNEATPPDVPDRKGSQSDQHQHHHHRLPAAASTNRDPEVNNPQLGASPPAVTTPLRPEDTAGHWHQVDQKRLPGSGKYFQLWPPPPRPPPPPPNGDTPTRVAVPPRGPPSGGLPTRGRG
ncbi:hypothetical protein GE09DRAFT_71415 [Coniochaeta sp. 2T2.1]|nr:hypothetical protein GE09DRAFT_71415 [Coniochaeta sp. 2T2.1]